jgi:hypothetical protein
MMIKVAVNGRNIEYPTVYGRLSTTVILRVSKIENNIENDRASVINEHIVSLFQTRIRKERKKWMKYPSHKQRYSIYVPPPPPRKHSSLPHI